MAYPKITTELVPEKVNLNGTSRETLVANYANVLKALRDLDAAMSLATPHGRDYQTLSDPEAANKAFKAWAERRFWLVALYRDIEHSAQMVASAN